MDSKLRNRLGMQLGFFAHSGLSAKETIDHLESIALEYSKKECIDFVDWCEDNFYPSAQKGVWFDRPDFDEATSFTTKELFEKRNQI